MVAHHVCEQINDLHYTLCMMGIPIDGPAWAFGDNASVITSSTIPQSTLNKQHNALAYHRVCESIAAKILYLVQVLEGKYNPSTSHILTKALGWVNVGPLFQPLLFWKGETIIDKPFPMVIKEIKDDPTFALRGVTGKKSSSISVCWSFP
jgi:hypothetical protein